MSREALASTLIGELYVVTGKSSPMDPRRIKRISNIMFKTGWDNAETVNRIAAAYWTSRDLRKQRRSGAPR